MVNMLANPGFEEDPITVEDGGFWFLRVWGTGPPVPAEPFSTETVDVYEGARAIRCHVEDPAGCQFAVGQYTKVGNLDPAQFTPGVDYHVRIAYKSDIPLQIVLQISDATGMVVSQTLDLPASPTWTQSPWILFIFPTGATYIQWFVINSYQVGDFLVDSAELDFAAAPPQRNVTVTSTPVSGVPVNVDGSFAGNTPISISVAEGSHMIDVPLEVET